MARPILELERGKGEIEEGLQIYYQAQRQREEESVHMLIRWLNDDQRLEQAEPC